MDKQEENALLPNAVSTEKMPLRQPGMALLQGYSFLHESV